MANSFWRATGIRPMVLNIGIDLRKFTMLTKRDYGRTLLYVGRISAYRKQDFLLEVVKLLKKRGLKVKLIFAGSLSLSDVDYYSRLLRRVNELDLEEEVIIANISSDDELLDTYSRGTVYLCPVAETYGINVLEALASGMPVVTLNEGGQLDIVRHNVEGFLVSEDPKEWVEAISKLLVDRELYDRMSKAALNRAKEFSWDSVIVKLESLLQS